MKRFFYLFCLHTLFSLVACTQVNNKTEMEATATKLISFLSNYDTASIVRLHVNYHDSLLSKKGYAVALKPVLRDCRVFKEIIDKHGAPKSNDFLFQQGISGEPEISIPLFLKKDTALKMNSAKLVVNFYPFQFYSPNKIRHYRLEIDWDRPKDIIMLPPNIPQSKKL